MRIPSWAYNHTKYELVWSGWFYNPSIIKISDCSYLVCKVGCVFPMDTASSKLIDLRIIWWYSNLLYIVVGQGEFSNKTWNYGRRSLMSPLIIVISAKILWLIWKSWLGSNQMMDSVWSWVRIHGPSGPGTDRSESVRDFQNFVGSGPVRYHIWKFFLVLVWSGSRVSNFARSGRRFGNLSRSWF